MSVCQLCGEEVGSLEAHVVAVTIYPDDKDDEIPVHPDCCPGEACDSPFEHPERVDL